jgi:hypothetical protein
VPVEQQQAALMQAQEQISNAVGLTALTAVFLRLFLL